MRKCVSNIPVVLPVNYPKEWLIYNIAKSPLRFHRATTNLVKKNYLFCTEDNPSIRYNTTYEADIKKMRNRAYRQGEESYCKALEKAIEKWEPN